MDSPWPFSLCWAQKYWKNATNSNQRITANKIYINYGLNIDCQKGWWFKQHQRLTISRPQVFRWKGLKFSGHCTSASALSRGGTCTVNRVFHICSYHWDKCSGRFGCVLTNLLIVAEKSRFNWMTSTSVVPCARLNMITALAKLCPWRARRKCCKCLRLVSF